MAVLVLAAVLIFTLLIFRLLCFRTTLSVRSLATFFVLGSILGVLALPVAEKFFNSYHFEGSPAYALLMIAMQHLLMVLPVLILISRPAWRNGASLGDAFLAGAMIGLGYDFLSSFIGVMSTTGIPASFSFSFLPPGVVAATPHTVAGFAYWTGAVALVCAASLRFFNRRIIAVLVTCVMLLIVGLDSYAAWYTTDFAKSVDKITLHGGLVGWLVLLLVVASAVMERRWVGPQATTWPFAEIQSVLTALVGLNWHEARRQGAEFRLKRQLENLNASAERQPANPSLGQETQAVNALLRSVAQPASQAARPDVLAWAKRRWLQVTAVALFAILAFVLPNFDRLGPALWNWEPLGMRLPPFQLTALSMLLIAMAGWHFIIMPVRPFSTVLVDEVARSTAERLLAQLGLAVAVMATLYPKPQEFLAFQSPLATADGLRVPGWNEMQALTVLLALCWAASGLTIRRAEAWRKSPDHLKSVVRNLLTVFIAWSLAWTSFIFFNQLQLYVHTHYGVTFFNWFKTNGNSIAEMLEGVITAAFAFVALWILRLVVGRMDRFLKIEGKRTEPAAAATSVGAKNE